MDTLTSPINIIIAEDHLLFADGLEQILMTIPNFQVIAKVGNGKLLMQTLNNLKPHLLLLDINMPYMNGMEAAPIIKSKFPTIKIVFLSMYYDSKMIAFAKQHHLSGFISKNIMAPDLKNALLQIMQGEEVFIFPGKNEKEEQAPPNDEFSRVLKLSPREIEIIAHIKQGKTSREISFILKLSEYTIEAHRKNIFRKLKVKNAAELIAVVS